MDEPCFCSVDGILSCLVDNTKVSLPMLITVCALAYIWTAKKKMKDMKKQCDVLEDDMQSIKRENYEIIEEIRRLNCAASDSLLVTSPQCQHCPDRKRKSAGLCAIEDKPVFNPCSNADRSISRKMKRRKSRNIAPICLLDEMDHLSQSTPESICDSPPKCSFPKSSELQTQSFEWQPKAESTRRARPRTSTNCCSFHASTPGTNSFCNHFQTSKTLFSCGNRSDLSPGRCARRKSHSSEPLTKFFDCCKPPETDEATCPMDSNGRKSNFSSPKRQCSERKAKKTQPTKSPKYNATVTFNTDPKPGSPNAPSCDKTPLCGSTSFQLKEKIERCKQDLADNMRSCKSPFRCSNLKTSDGCNDDDHYESTHDKSRCH